MDGADTIYNQNILRPNLDTAFYHRIANGDQTAFAILIAQYHKTVFSVAYRLTRSVPLSEEIVQDVFLKIWLKRDGLTEIVNFPAWLNTISTNTIYSALRQQQRDVLSISDTDLEDNRHPAVNNTEDVVQDREYETLLERAIRRLPERQQQTYILIKREGMKRDAAAAAMNISPETVKSNLEQAMKNIRAYCKANLGLLMVILFLGR